MIHPTEINEDLVDRVLKSLHSALPIDADKRAGTRLRLETILTKTAENQISARWDVRTGLDKTVKTLVKEIPALLDDLRRFGNQLADADIGEPLRVAALEAAANGKRPHYTPTPVKAGFAAPSELIEQIGAGFKDLKDILHHAGSASAITLEPLLLCLQDMQTVPERWIALISDEPIAECLRLTAVEAYAGPASTLAPRGDSDVSAFRALWRLEFRISALEDIINHFVELSAEFYSSSSNGSVAEKRENWINKGIGDLSRDARRYLVPFLRNRKRGGVGPDTELLRAIAELYQYVRGKPFRINGSESKRSYQRIIGNLELHGFNGQKRSLRSTGLVRYKSGEAMNFACAIIQGLGLQSLIVPFENDELGFDPLIHGEDERPAAYDVKKHNRAFISRSRTVPRAELIDRIGDLWKHDLQRT